MSPIEAAVLRSVIVPSVVCGLVVLGTGELPLAWRARAQATALSLAFAAGSYALLEHLSFPPADVNDAFTWVALALGLFVWVAPRHVGTRYGVRALFTLAGLTVLLFHIRTALAGPVHLRNLAAFGCLSLGLWSITESNARRVTPPTALLLPMISGVAVSVLCLISGSTVIAQLVGIVCGLLGAGVAVAVVFPRRVAVDAFVPFASVFIALAMTAAHFYLDINPWHLIAAAWPFAVLWGAPRIGLPPRAWIETPALALTAAAPLGWFVYGVVRSAGPLY